MVISWKSLEGGMLDSLAVLPESCNRELPEFHWKHNTFWTPISRIFPLLRRICPKTGTFPRILTFSFLRENCQETVFSLFFRQKLSKKPGTYYSQFLALLKIFLRNYWWKKWDWRDFWVKWVLRELPRGDLGGSSDKTCVGVWSAADPRLIFVADFGACACVCLSAAALSAERILSTRHISRLTDPCRGGVLSLAADFHGRPSSAAVFSTTS